MTRERKATMHLPVMCYRCARIYIYLGQPEARCPKCGFSRWADPRQLCRDVADHKPGAIQQLTSIVWRATEFVEEGDTNEDLA